MMNFGRPIMYRVAHQVNGGDWKWLGPIHYTGDAAVRYMGAQPFSNNALKEDRKVISMMDEEAGNNYLEQLNRNNVYHPTPAEIKRWNFVKWLRDTGRAYLHNPVLDTP